MTVVYILLAVLGVAAASMALGRLLLVQAGLRFPKWEARALAFLTGASVYSLLLFLLGMLHLYYKGVFYGLPIVLVGLAWRFGALRPGQLHVEPAPPPFPRWAKRACLAVALPFFLLALSNAMAPEVSPDGASYHVGLITRYYRAHGLYPIYTNMYAALSQGAEMLFLAGFAIGRHSATAMVHLLFTLCLPVLVAGYGRKVGKPLEGLAAALFVFCCPLLNIDGSTAYNDVMLAAVYFGVFRWLVALDEAAETGEGRWSLAQVVPVALLAGFCFAIKYTAAPAVVAVMAWLAWRSRLRQPKILLLAAAVAGTQVAPWLLRNWFWYRNPFAPLYNSWFPNPYFSQLFERDYRASMAIYGLQSWWDLPWALTWNGEPISGMLGPLFVLAPLALVALRWNAGRYLLLAWLVASCTYFSNVGARFLLPGLSFLALAMAMGFAGVFGATAGRAVLAIVVAAHALVSWPDIFRQTPMRNPWYNAKIVWREALRLRSEDAFLSTRIYGYNFLRRMEQKVPPGRRVLSFQQLPEAYLNVDLLVGFQSTEGEQMLQAVQAAMEGVGRPDRRVEFPFAPRKVTRLRIEQTKAHPNMRWTLAELRFRRAKTEVARSSHWRIRAFPNPFQVGNAFDGSLASRWNADATIAPGQFVEVDFGTPVELDLVEVVSSGDHPFEEFRLLADGEAVASAPNVIFEANPQLLRRQAALELLARNVQYVVTQSTDWSYKELTRFTKEYGMEVVDREGGFTLLRILP